MLNESFTTLRRKGRMRLRYGGRRTAAGRCLRSPGIVVLALALAACSTSEPAPGPGGTTTVAPARLEISMPDGSKEVSPASVLTVRAVDGRLGEVTVTSADGKRTVAGKTGADHVWTSTGRLLPRTTYRITASATNAGGDATSRTASFTTLTPDRTVDYTVTPDGWTVGAGMPIQVNFDDPIPKESRAAIEAQLTINTVPAQPGAWGWTSNTTLMYRPQSYWAPGTKIEVSAPLAGTQVAPGAYLMEDNGAKLTIGTQRILRVDLAGHTMTNTENGKLVQTFLISGGRPGQQFETRGGTKVVMDKYEKIIMDSSTFGIGKMDPEYYRTPVNYAMRITDTGEFLHSAPWSVGQQGYANVSHGCINMAPGDARGLFNVIQYGDVVETTGSRFPLQPGEAGIPVWLYTWPQWQALSARPPAATPAPATPAATGPKSAPSAATGPASAPSPAPTAS